MRAATSMAVVGWVLLAGATIAHPDSGEEAAALASRLPLDQAIPGRGENSGPVEARLAGLGDSAVPALEHAMQLGMKGREAQAFIDSGKSRRYAAIRVLGRIDSRRSTAVLIAAVRDYGDFNGLCDSIVHELRPRALTVPELELLLTSASPSAIRFALGKAGTVEPGSPLSAAATDLFDPKRVHGQLRNGNGHPIGGEETRWEIHLAAGRALGRDMDPEIRDRAAGIVGELLAVPRSGWKGTGRSERFSTLDGPEFEVTDAIRRLVPLGAPGREVVDEARRIAVGGEAEVLDLALLACGDATRQPAVAGILTDSPHTHLRVCAAMVLRGTNDPRTRAAWWKAMDDPMSRQAGGCVRIPGRETVYPVREIAADALIRLGEPPKALRARLLPPGPEVPALRWWTMAGIGAVAVLMGLWVWSVRGRRLRLP